nr:MAG TPA: hypothetical protein [Caudoviricetes sp.]
MILLNALKSKLPEMPKLQRNTKRELKHLQRN